jgi:hypothetical protein
MSKECDRCGSTTGCARDTGWPCTAKQAENIENRYYRRYHGTTDLAARGNRSFWD